jgi:hypothetical protein
MDIALMTAAVPIRIRFVFDAAVRAVVVACNAVFPVVFFIFFFPYLYY